jgi:hypothetical protein
MSFGSQDDVILKRIEQLIREGNPPNVGDRIRFIAERHEAIRQDSGRFKIRRGPAREIEAEVTARRMEAVRRRMGVGAR